MLERMEMIAPAHVDNPFHFSFRQPESLPNPLLKMEKVSAGYGDRIILVPYRVMTQTSQTLFPSQASED